MLWAITNNGSQISQLSVSADGEVLDVRFASPALGIKFAAITAESQAMAIRFFLGSPAGVALCLPMNH